MKLHLFQGFKADRRLSMDIYAQRLFSELNTTTLDTHLFRPMSRLESYSESRFVMRYLRYVGYPNQARNYCKTDVDAHDVRHILDHGYSHLLKALQSSSGSHPTSSVPKTCVTVHDLIPILAWRGRFGRDHVARRPRLALHSAKYLSSATKLFAVSSNTANDLHTEFDIPTSRIEVVPSPLDTAFVRAPESKIREFNI